MPQSWNRYAYVLNNPLRHIDPTGKEEEEPEQGQIVKLGEDKKINEGVNDINKAAKPLPAGDTPVPTSVKIIPGQQTVLNNATIVDADGNTVAAGVKGYMQPVALVVRDQGGNIMKAPNDMFVVENAQGANADAQAIAQKGNQITTNAVEVSQANNGVFYDVQARVPGQNP